MSHFRKADKVREEKLKELRPELDLVRIKVGTPIREALEVMLD